MGPKLKESEHKKFVGKNGRRIKWDLEKRELWVDLIKINYMLYEIHKQTQLYPLNLEMTTVGISVLTAAQKVLGRLPS